MKKNWLIALYKSNQIKRVEANLLNQKFEYYLPKIFTRKANSKIKKELLFPGYIFINTNLENYWSLKYTNGIKDILKFGNNISLISNEEIKSMQMIEDKSQKDPLAQQIEIGKDFIVSDGSLKGNIVQICSLPSQERVNVFLTIFGSKRRINIRLKDLTF